MQSTSVATRGQVVRIADVHRSRAAERRSRWPGDDRRGVILLFTGVRYERQPDRPASRAVPAGN